MLDELATQQDLVPPAEEVIAPDPSRSNGADSEDILLETDCKLVKLTKTFMGVFRVTASQIHFLEKPNTTETKLKRKHWMIREIKRIYFRRFVLRKTAIEIFFMDNTNYFFDFPNRDHRKYAPENFDVFVSCLQWHTHPKNQRSCFDELY